MEKNKNCYYYQTIYFGFYLNQKYFIKINTYNYYNIKQ